MGKHKHVFQEAVSEMKHFLVGAGLVLTLVAVVPALAQSDSHSGGGTPPADNVGGHPASGQPVTEHGQVADPRAQQHGQGQQGQDVERGQVPGQGRGVESGFTGQEQRFGSNKKTDGRSEESGKPSNMRKSGMSNDDVERFMKGKTDRNFGSEKTQDRNGQSETQRFNVTEQKEFLDKDLIKMFGKEKSFKPAFEIPQLETDTDLSDRVDMLDELVTEFVRTGKKLSRKTLRKNAVIVYSELSRLVQDEERDDLVEDLGDLKLAIRKAKKAQLIETVTEVWSSIREKIMEGDGDEAEEEEEELLEE